MKPKSISGTLCYVKNLEATVKFYEILGLQFKVHEPDHAVGYLNWFSMEFVAQEKAAKAPEFQQEAEAIPRGSGFFVYVSVENVDAFYEYLLSKGLEPSSKPRDWPWGNREFVIRDPDGYKIVIFKRQKPRSPAE